MSHIARISRRDFFKLSILAGGALAVAVALSATAVASSAAPLPNAGNDDLPASHPLTIRFGTPTDVAATWPGEAWSVDAEGVIRRFDQATHVWLPDVAGNEAGDEADFPAGSQLVMARWGRPAGPNQMLLVLGPSAGTSTL